MRQTDKDIKFKENMDKVLDFQQKSQPNSEGIRNATTFGQLTHASRYNNQCKNLYQIYGGTQQIDATMNNTPHESNQQQGLDMSFGIQNTGTVGGNTQNNNNFDDMPTLQDGEEDGSVDTQLANNFQNTSFDENTGTPNQPSARSNVPVHSNPNVSGNSQPSHFPNPTNAPQNSLNRSITDKDSFKIPNSGNFHNKNDEKDKNVLKIRQSHTNIENIKVEYGALNPINESADFMRDVEVLETSIVKNQRLSLNSTTQSKSNQNTIVSETSNGSNSIKKMLNSQAEKRRDKQLKEKNSRNSNNLNENLSSSSVINEVNELVSGSAPNNSMNENSQVLNDNLHNMSFGTTGSQAHTESSLNLSVIVPRSSTRTRSKSVNLSSKNDSLPMEKISEDNQSNQSLIFTEESNFQSSFLNSTSGSIFNNSYSSNVQPTVETPNVLNSYSRNITNKRGTLGIPSKNNSGNKVETINDVNIQRNNPLKRKIDRNSQLSQNNFGLEVIPEESSINHSRIESNMIPTRSRNSLLNNSNSFKSLNSFENSRNSINQSKVYHHNQNSSGNISNQQLNPGKSYSSSRIPKLNNVNQSNSRLITNELNLTSMERSLPLHSSTDQNMNDPNPLNIKSITRRINTYGKMDKNLMGSMDFTEPLNKIDKNKNISDIKNKIKKEMEINGENMDYCSICQESLMSKDETNVSEDKVTVLLECGHIFHNECLKNHRKQTQGANMRKKCPNCRTQLKQI